MISEAQGVPAAHIFLSEGPNGALVAAVSLRSAAMTIVVACSPGAEKREDEALAASATNNEGCFPGAGRVWAIASRELLKQRELAGGGPKRTARKTPGSSRRGITKVVPKVERRPSRQTFDPAGVSGIGPIG